MPEVLTVIEGLIQFAVERIHTGIARQDRNDR
jgi:hypothetical protein